MYYATVTLKLSWRTLTGNNYQATTGWVCDKKSKIIDRCLQIEDFIRHTSGFEIMVDTNSQNFTIPGKRFPRQIRYCSPD